MVFPGGPVVKNPSCNAGNTGSIPGPGGSHVPLSLCATTTDPVLWSLWAPATEPTHQNLCSITREGSVKCWSSIHVRLSNIMDCSPPGFSLRGIFQARKLEWVAISFSRASSWPRNWTHVSYVSCTYEPARQAGSLPLAPPEMPPKRAGKSQDLGIKTVRERNFPGGPVVKNLPKNAGDMNSIPGPGRSHMPQSNKPLSSKYWAHVPTACALQHWEVHSRQWRAAPACRNSRKPVHSDKDPVQPKINK